MASNESNTSPKDNPLVRALAQWEWEGGERKMTVAGDTAKDDGPHEYASPACFLHEVDPN